MSQISYQVQVFVFDAEPNWDQIFERIRWAFTKFTNSPDSSYL